MKKIVFLSLFALLSLTACGQGNTENKTTPTIPSQEPSSPSPTTAVAATNTPSPTAEPTPDADIITPTAAPSATDAPDELLKLTAEIEYSPVTFDGLTRFELTDNTKGLLLDLDGDGKEEQLYCAKEGIYINGILAASPWKIQNTPYFQPWEQLWLVDVDSSDSYLNLIFKLGNGREILVWYHDGIQLEEYENFSHNAFTDSAEYRGDGTILIQACHVPVPCETWFRPVEFVWDAQNGMRLAEQTVILQEEEHAKNSEHINGGPWQLLSDIKLYADPRFDAESITVQSGQTVYELKTYFSDYNHYWIFLTTEQGEQGWFYVEETDNATYIINQEKDAWDVITGFSSAG